MDDDKAYGVDHFTAYNKKENDDLPETKLKVTECCDLSGNSK